MNIAVVIPTIRSLSFLAAWGTQFAECDLIVVEDHPTKEITVPEIPMHSLSHYTWESIRADFGDDEWIFSRQNAGIRSYGFWKAYQNGADVIITLDDDCFPLGGGFVQSHVRNLGLSAPQYWYATFPHPDFMFTRGYPYNIRNRQKVMVSHGLWSKNLDLDGMTQKQNPHLNMYPYPPMLSYIPQGLYYPMCSMNLAFNRDITPLMYFPLMGKDPDGKQWGFDRFDDIWAGIFSKKIMDHLGMAVVNGSPFVEHQKASDADTNIQKEKTGIEVNEDVWKWVDAVELTKTTPALCYRELSQKIKFPKTGYFESLRKAMGIWSDLFHI